MAAAPIIPAFTTPFAPNPSCSSVYISGSLSPTRAFVLTVGPHDAQSSCFPSGWVSSTDSFFSPATVCPSGMTSKALTTVSLKNALPETQAICCPNGYTYVASLSAFPGQLCTSAVTSGGLVTLLSSNAVGAVATTVISLGTTDGVNAYGMKIRYQVTPTTTPSSSAPSSSSSATPAGTIESSQASATATATNTPIQTDTGLSTGAKAGIGAGVGVGALVVLALLILFIWRRKRSQAANAPAVGFEPSSGFATPMGYNSPPMQQSMHEGQGYGWNGGSPITMNSAKVAPNQNYMPVDAISPPGLVELLSPNHAAPVEMDGSQHPLGR